MTKTFKLLLSAAAVIVVIGFGFVIQKLYMSDSVPQTSAPTTVSLNDYVASYKRSPVKLSVAQIDVMTKVFSLGFSKCVVVEEMCSEEMVKDGMYLGTLSLFSDAQWNDSANHVFYFQYGAEGGPIYFGPFTDNVFRLNQEASQMENLIVSSVSRKLFAEYFATRDQFVNTGMAKDSSGMNEDPKTLGFTVLVTTPVTCPDSAGTPCGGDVSVLSKDPVHAGNQEFYLAFSMGTGYTYHGPFMDDLQRIVTEAKTTTSLGK